ncbi:hypothetical protein BC937DRAFT_92014 [Endogone sp. FLAS-F59071]|nr:hypothetical protein BC937DRAFT_92014 [Endogone sp. FLAS-F59071]|eukprot:RUS15769.1 hypothetical protein BC937DRAFT_92014 [Endogone sp. FLAS-F59071]
MDRRLVILGLVFRSRTAEGSHRMIKLIIWIYSNFILPPQRIGERVTKRFQVVKALDVNDTCPNFIGGLCDRRSFPSPLFSDNEMFVDDGLACNQVVLRSWVGSLLDGVKDRVFVLICGVLAGSLVVKPSSPNSQNGADDDRLV